MADTMIHAKRACGLAINALEQEDARRYCRASAASTAVALAIVTFDNY